MSLFEYLTTHYYGQKQLLEACHINEDCLIEMQQSGLFPKPSYRLANNIECSSYYGLHQCQEYWDYYPRGYLKWAKIVSSNNKLSTIQAYEIFFTSYCTHLSYLQNAGLCSKSEIFSDDIHEHIQGQWQHFLNGKFGLTTQNGTIEEIVEIEVSMDIILDITQCHSKENLSDAERKTVRNALKYLNRSLSQFAPHERPQSYRTKLIDNTIKQYDLSV